MKVLVVLGGVSAEREVSLKSGDNVVRALNRAGHSVATFDPKTDGNITEHLISIDVIFPILHGKGGEDGHIQQKLEKLKVPFVGSGSKASSDCFDKYKTQQMLPKVLCPKTEIVDLKSFKSSGLIKQPFVIKPIDEGSSIDTLIVRDTLNYKEDLVESFFTRHSKMMLQKLIEGIELTVPVLKDSALPVIEIIPPSGKEFDYENKYNGATKEIVPPLNIPLDVQANAQALALDIHNQMGCRSFSRSDFILSKQDGQLYFLEINTLPGMTAESLFPKAAKVADISIEQLVDILVKDAFN